MTARGLSGLAALVVLFTFPALGQSGKSDAVASAPGRIVGFSDVVPVGTAATGVVSEVRVNEGDHVTKGQVLLQLDCKTLAAEVRQREAEVVAAEAAQTRLKAGARDEEIAIAMAYVTVAEARAEEAERAFQRLMSLHEGIASRARLGELERDSKIAGGQLLEARMRLRMLQAGARGEDVVEAEAKTAGAKAARDRAQARLDECTVRAPVEGTVLVRNVTPGQLVAASSALPLVQLVDDRVLRVRAEVDERDLRQVYVGQRARITATGYDDMSLVAEVSQISPGMAARTIPDEPAEKHNREIRLIFLTLPANEMRWPIGLRVRASFQKC